MTLFHSKPGSMELLSVNKNKKARFLQQAKHLMVQKDAF